MGGHYGQVGGREGIIPQKREMGPVGRVHSQDRAVGVGNPGQGGNIGQHSVVSGRGNTDRFDAGVEG